MKKFPFVKQDGMKNCGAACLAMIIQYYKGYISLDELTISLKTNREGTSAFDLVKTAKTLGFNAYGRKYFLNENIILPCIAHITTSSMLNHYVVIYNIDFQKQIILYADPGIGIVKKSFNDFNQLFNEVVIILYPLKTIPYKNHVSITQVSLSILKNYKLKIISLWFLSLTFLILSLAGSFYFKILFDNLIDNTLLLYIPIIFIFLLFLKTLISYIRNNLSITLSNQIDQSLTFENFKKLLSLPYLYYRNYTTGEFISRMNDLHIVKSLINKILIFIMIDVPLSIGIITLLICLSKYLSYMIIFILIVYLLINYVILKKNSYHIDLVKNHYALSTSYLAQTLTGIETIKGLSIEDKINANFEKQYNDYLSCQKRADLKFSRQIIFNDLIISISEIVILFYGYLLVYLEKFELGNLIIFNALILYLFEICKNTMNLSFDIKEGRIIFSRVFELKKEFDSTGNIERIKTGTIKFKRLNYANSEKTLYENVSLEIAPASKVLILGSSGEGKSTLFNIIMKNYSIAPDQIFIDDDDINDYKRSALKQDISYLSQEQFLYADTIMNNINFYGNEEEIKKVAELCCINDVNDLNYLIEENGFNISGGEKQRIALCRALLKPSKIVLIDEGLNQIDVNLERKILKNIFEYFNERTFIIISHRTDNIDLYNQVLELKNNSINSLCKNSR